MSGSYSPKITIVGTHGRNLGKYLQEHLKSKGIRSFTVGAMNLKNKSTERKIKNASTLICVNKEVRKIVEDTFELTKHKVICLDVHDMPESASSKPLTGESWLEYQNEYVRPELERQIKKHLKKLID